MASTSHQTYDDAVGSNSNQASSSSPAIAESGAHQHQHQQQQQQESQQQQHQQIHFGSNQSPSDSAAQHQQLFSKPHPAMLPIISSSSNSDNNAIEINSVSFTSGTVDTPPKPLHATVLDAQQHQQQHQYPNTSIAVATTPSSSPSPSPNTLDHIGHSNPHFAWGDGVKEPLPTDVICGRGKMTSSHPANRRFRELVDSHKASYQNSKRRDEKTRITCELVDKLRGEGR